MITLCSDRLRIEMPEAGERPNDRTRFERAGYISEVVLDGDIQFAANEPKNLSHPPTGGRGLCSEYRTDYSAEAATGGYYPKLGVGLIRKMDEQPYLFHRRYEDVQVFPVECTHTVDSAAFVTEPVPCMGYALRTEKTVRVTGNRLKVETTAENTGEKSIELFEFCHNFISVDGMALGPSYRVEFPTLRDFGQARMIGINGKPCSLRGNGRGFTYAEYSEGASHIRVDCAGTDVSRPFTWKIINDAAKAFVEGTESYQPVEIEIWSIDHILCPEVFQRVLLEPGKQYSWKRTWTFDTFE